MYTVALFHKVQFATAFLKGFLSYDLIYFGLQDKLQSAFNVYMWPKKCIFAEISNTPNITLMSD